MKMGTWNGPPLKPYNFDAKGINMANGALHPLMKMRNEMRKILLEMGFEEMPTNNFVESSFWNFDSLFQPQQHPARDAHDTFFLKKPASSTIEVTDYMNLVKKTHSEGGFGSIGWRYDWKQSEAEKPLLRTHTTAISSRMLYQLAQQKQFRPMKYFSIDRVFRNEAIDATHLAEFHQVEGLIADYGLTLGHLIGVISQFFQKIGIQRVSFKPAYNPYTEPSMEIFGWSEERQKWIEVGNSGVFRPEMLLPMGLPPNVQVIAWGLGLERPCMIATKCKDIRELFGPKVDINMVQNFRFVRYDKLKP
ncbi:phenylalanyl-tRNA synthetase alpha chain [Reticulomyxa filosa]|uniref:phenylalanine--tRNA ligase n=1 Tax=Reticulomyxa filosa TaxID=46433 RepID=X6NYP1_RETFI|nr:phenylalanyl-tRNA synthetase alpha chain [Reticulomyxa filosa]|eukprot:ETO31415.1 phenylalanyl-tRNA synthetase alpha chain [Reticulomyxa filosa]